MAAKASLKKDSVSQETSPKDFSGGKDVPVDEKSTSASEERKLVVDERVIPDSSLPTESVGGILDIATEGSGLLRPKFAHSEQDIYISASQIRRFNLRLGDKVGGQARRPKENERYWGLLKVETVNGVDVEKLKGRPESDDMVAIYPDSQIVLSTESEKLTTRVIDLVAPIGFGQRGLIVSPPKAGKTWLIKDIMSGIAKNYPEKSSFENFFPHITIGYGEINNFSFPIIFSVSKLALCHLGNHCTCRKILASTNLKKS